MGTAQELFRNAGFKSPFVHGEGQDEQSVRVIHNGPLGAPYAYGVGGRWFVPARFSSLKEDYEPAHTDEWVEPDAKITAYLQALPLNVERISAELRARAFAVRDAGTPKPSAKAANKAENKGEK